MKTTLRIVCLSAAVWAMILPVLAQTAPNAVQPPPNAVQTPPNQKPPSINRRLENQQDRIGQGITSGQLTAGEAANVETKESAITNEVRADRQANGGKLTQAERTQVNHQLNRTQNRSIAISTTELASLTNTLLWWSRLWKTPSHGEGVLIFAGHHKLERLEESYLAWPANCGLSLCRRGDVAASSHHGQRSANGGLYVDRWNRQHRFRSTCKRAAQLSEGSKRIQTARPGLANWQPDPSPGRFRNPVPVVGQQPADRCGRFRRDVTDHSPYLCRSECGEPARTSQLRFGVAPPNPFSTGAEPTGSGAAGGQSYGGAASLRNHGADLAAVWKQCGGQHLRHPSHPVNVSA